MAARLTHEDAGLPGLLRLVNSLAGGAAKLGLKSGPLSAERILRGVTLSTGLSDFGESDIVEPLGVLVDALEREARLTPIGHKGAQGILTQTLAKRLRIVDWLKQHPEVKREEIRRPIFVLGLPRTGTTLLFNLLAQDPAARPLLGWEAFQPLSPKKPRPGRRDPRIDEYARKLRGMDYISPYLRKLHPMTAEGPEECNLLLMRSLVTWFYGFQFRVPSYTNWLWSRPRSVHEMVYRLHRDQLEILQTQNRGGHWLLKSPSHLNALGAIAEVYPDACFVQTHRDLSKVLPSACSLFAVARRAASDEVEPVALGREALTDVEQTISGMLEARKTLPAERVLDVRYADFVRRPLDTVQRIYEQFDLTAPEELETRIDRWMKANPKDKSGAHHYSLEAFGTSRGELDERSAAYRERFDIPREE